MLTWRRALAALALGLLILIAGLGYDIAFAGIPYQDPTPAMASAYRFHSRVASVIVVGGLALLLIGLVGSSAVGLRSIPRRTSS